MIPLESALGLSPKLGFCIFLSSNISTVFSSSGQEYNRLNIFVFSHMDSKSGGQSQTQTFIKLIQMKLMWFIPNK